MKTTLESIKNRVLKPVLRPVLEVNDRHPRIALPYVSPTLAKRTPSSGLSRKPHAFTHSPVPHDSTGRCCGLWAVDLAGAERVHLLLDDRVVGRRVADASPPVGLGRPDGEDLAFNPPPDVLAKLALHVRNRLARDRARAG